MPQNVFDPGLNDFCRKYLVDTGVPITPTDQISFPRELQKQKDFLFEHLLLFDCVTFKIYGENVPLVFLLQAFGQKQFEALLEQQAFGFVLWTPSIGCLVKNIPGVEAIVHGNLSSPAHSDPEQSIELGLGWLSKPLTKRERRHLVKKVLPLYKLPDPELPGMATGIVKNALRQGRLSNYGLNNVSPQLDNLSTGDKDKLAKCATDLLEYKFLISNDMTSFSEYKYFSPFWDTLERFNRSENVKKGFAKVLEVEGFPHLPVISAEMSQPFAQLARLRDKRSARKMRTWLAETSEKKIDPDFVQEYIASIAERKDVGSTAKGKLTKSILMTTIGAGIGAAADFFAGAAGLPIGGLTVPGAALGASGSLGVDLLDRFVVEKLQEGWSPRIFIDDITKMRKP